jgi:hypothetical protein
VIGASTCASALIELLLLCKKPGSNHSQCQVKTASFEAAFTWLAVSFWNITITKENEPNVNEIRNLIDGNAKEEKQAC